MPQIDQRHGGLVLVLALCAAGCSSLPQSIPKIGESSAAATKKDHFKAAIEMLDLGDAKHARNELRALIKQQPDNKKVEKLLKSVDDDPVELLGKASFSYVVKPGESMSEIAGRYLNEPLLFYALARYNNISAPRDMVAGQTLRIPGKLAVVAPKVAADPERAGKLRVAALVQLNKGDAGGAIAQLKAARELDPQNGAIQQDLERATRIQKMSSAR